VALARLRDQFPVLAQTAYLNAGSCGPIPAAGAQAAIAEIERAAAEGRDYKHFQRRVELAAELRAAFAAVAGASPADVALTTSTSEGLATVVTGLALGRGDEIVTSDVEHPGLLGPLAAARDLRGVDVRAVPLEDVANAVGPRTRLVACSHVSWHDGRIAPVESLAALGDDVAVVLDGAQSLGAIPVNVDELGCAAFAAAGQKWLCGPEGTGMLWISPAWRERIGATARPYGAQADPALGLEGELHPDARRYEASSLSAEEVAYALGSVGLLAEAGWDEVYAAATGLAARFAEELAARGRDVAPRGNTTLVSWVEDDPMATNERLAATGVVTRYLPGTSYVRASTGAWNDESDLERLLAALP
jgi:L-cysteine/cystine lyase